MMMQWRKTTLAVALGLCLSFPSFSDILVPNDTSSNPPPANLEASLFEIYNGRYGTGFTTNSDLTGFQIDDAQFFDAAYASGGISVQSVANWAFLTQNFGYYTVDSGTGDLTFNELLGDMNNTQNTPGPVVSFEPGQSFGFYDAANLPESFFQSGTFPGYTPGDHEPGAIGHTWYSEIARNDANFGTNPGEDHMLFFSTDDPYIFLLAWEDLPFDHSDSGFDFNDLVIELRLNPIIPEPTSMVLLGLGIAALVARRRFARTA